MPRAVSRDDVLAESEDTKVVEGNHYFPPDSVRDAVLGDGPTRTVCFWKGHVAFSPQVRIEDWTFPCGTALRVAPPIVTTFGATRSGETWTGVSTQRKLAT